MEFAVALTLSRKKFVLAKCENGMMNIVIILCTVASAIVII